MSVKNILDGTIPVGGVIPEDLSVNTLTATDEISTQYLAVGSMARFFNGMRIGGTLKVENSQVDETLGTIETPSLTATESIKAPALTLGETIVLTQTVSDNNQSIAVTYRERDEETLTAQVHSKVCNFNNEQHVLTCQTSLSSLSKAIKQMIIPTGLDFTGRSTVSTNTTAALINNTGLLLGFVRIYMESNQLMVKVVFKESPEYTSIIIKINIVFN